MPASGTWDALRRRVERAGRALLVFGFAACGGPGYGPGSGPTAPPAATPGAQAPAPVVSDNYDQFDHFHTLEAQFVIDFGDHTSEKVNSWTDPSGVGNAVVQDHTQTNDITVVMSAISKTPGVVGITWTPEVGQCTYTSRPGLNLSTCHYNHFCTQKAERSDVRILADGKELVWNTFASAYASTQHPGDAQQWAYVSYDEHVDTTLSDSDFQALASSSAVRLRFCGRELDLKPDQVATLRAFWARWSAVEGAPAVPAPTSAP